MKRLSYLLLFILLSTSVSADGFFEDVLGFDSDNGFDKVLNFFFFELGGVDTSTEAYVVAFRIMLFFLVFAILYGVSGRVPAITEWGKRPKVVIAVTLALIGTLAIPSDALVVISQLYGFLFFVLLVSAPIGAAAYVMFSKDVFGDSTVRVNVIIKFVIALVIWYALGMLTQAYPGLFEGAAVDASGNLVRGGGEPAIAVISDFLFNGFGAILAFAQAIFFFLWLYYLFVSIFFESEERREEKKGEAEERKAESKRKIKHLGKGSRAQQVIHRMDKIMRELYRAISRKEDRALRVLGTLNKINDRFHSFILRSYTHADDSQLVTELTGANEEVKKGLEAVEDKVRAKEWGEALTEYRKLERHVRGMRSALVNLLKS